MGGRGEARAEFLGKLANDNGWLIVLNDWVGMSSADGLSVFRLFVDKVNEFPYVPGRLTREYHTRGFPAWCILNSPHMPYPSDVHPQFGADAAFGFH